MSRGKERKILSDLSLSLILFNRALFEKGALLKRERF
jgi:hypothetical protein